MDDRCSKVRLESSRNSFSILRKDWTAPAISVYPFLMVAVVGKAPHRARHRPASRTCDLMLIRIEWMIGFFVPRDESIRWAHP